MIDDNKETMFELETSAEIAKIRDAHGAMADALVEMTADRDRWKLHALILAVCFSLVGGSATALLVRALVGGF